VSRRVVVSAALVTAVAVAIGLYLFQPWKAFTDTRVDEALPTGAVPAVVEPRGDQEETAAAQPPAKKDTAPVNLAQGTFVTHDHDTSGTARTVRLADGSRLLRIEDLETSDGPDVRVYLSTRSADEVESGLGEGAVQLGMLKGNLGNQNYTVPAGTDLSEFRSAVLWCKRFSVSFGAADLTPVAS
jgi:hypothetical protein